MDTGLVKGISKRYTNGHVTSPFSKGQLLEDVGFQGESPKVDGILYGKYKFPEDYLEPAQVLCKVAAKISKDNNYKVTATCITTKTFQDWWKTANENIMSLMYGVHFSHYKIAVYSDLPTSLHVAKLNLVLSSSEFLDRRCQSLMIFLEKEYGNIEFDKLRAVVLFKAAFNWI